MRVYAIILKAGMAYVIFISSSNVMYKIDKFIECVLEREREGGGERKKGGEGFERGRRGSRDSTDKGEGHTDR